MSIFRKLRNTGANLAGKTARDRDLDAEVNGYLDELTDEKINSGIAPEQARREARMELGGVEQVKEQTREARAGFLVEAFWRDLQFAFRGLRKRPGFTIIVVLSLALGIGANAAIFSLVDAIILRPLPVPRPHEIITIDTGASRLIQYGNSSYLDYIDFRNRAKSFKGMAISQGMSAGLNAAGVAPDSKPQIVYGLLVSGNFFSTLEVHPAAGRDFLAEEDTAPGKYPVAIISYRLWQRVFAGDPGVQGKIVKLNGHSFTIVGVAPKSFTGIDLFFKPDIYVPEVMSAQVMPDGADVLKQRSYRGFDIRGRLNPGVTLSQAQAEMDVIMRDLEREHPESNKDTVAYVRNDMNRRLGNGLSGLPLVLIGMVILVLLMACANVSSLLMAKATSRLKEVTTQLALGATRGRLVRQFLTESGLLAAMGCAAGIALAYGCIRGFTLLAPQNPGQAGPDFRLDVRVLICAVLVSAAAVLLFGLAPALTAVKDAWAATLSTRTPGSGSRSFSAIARRVLIGGQVALSVVLLIVAGLFLKAFSHAQNIDLGFNPNNLMLISVDPMLNGYSADQSARFHEQLLKRVRELPAVKSATIATQVPFVSGGSWDLSIDGYTAPSGERFLDTVTNQVGPEYFSIMQIPVLAGREFTERDNRKSPNVVIVNETFAKDYLTPDGNFEKALGRIVRLRDGGAIQIVGVAKDSNNGGPMGVPPNPIFYTPYFQQAATQGTLHIRGSGDAAALAAIVPEVRREISALDAGIAPVSVQTMTHVISEQGLFLPRIVALLCGAFGVVALALAFIGLYGVVSFMAARRTQEIGIRMTLGAQRGTVLRMILANGLVLAGVGLIIGLLGAGVATPLMREMLVGVSPWDPATYVAITAVLILATVLASWIPANRATRVDPMTALRYE